MTEQCTFVAEQDSVMTKESTAMKQVDTLIEQQDTMMAKHGIMMQQIHHDTIEHCNFRTGHFKGRLQLSEGTMKTKQQPQKTL